MAVEAPAAEDEPDAPEPVSFEIVYEDEHLLVVTSPRAWSRTRRRAPRPTLAEALAPLAAAAPIPSGPGSCTAWTATLRAARGGALRRGSRRAPADDEGARGHPEYTALVRVTRRRQRHDRRAHRPRPRNRTVMSTRTDRARSAVTHFEVLERLPRTALLRVRSKRAARTRSAHLAAIEHPVVGDPQYGAGAAAGSAWSASSCMPQN